MTQIVEETQLDFCDVMFKPKRSTLNSRSEPDVYRTYKFKWSGKEVVANGLMVANMATTGTFKMAEVMAKNKMFCCLQKHYTLEQLKDFFENHKEDKSFADYVFISTGIKEGDYEKIKQVLDLGLCQNLCIDIANGYIPNLIKFVKKIREEYPQLVIMVGNVVTGDMVQDLILSGADIAKIGIGSGCFTGDMKVWTDKGMKAIKDIMEGENVLTHTGEFHKVLTKFEYNNHKEIIKINDIECTPKHMFYVIDKEKKNIVNDDNYNEYAYWVNAEDLSEVDHLLLKIS